ncbi:MAG: diguanylate cyclase [Burkholderiales bacterium]|nr:diguanylate cyclase [Burkholderiales bacterium]
MPLTADVSGHSAAPALEDSPGWRSLQDIFSRHDLLACGALPLLNAGGAPLGCLLLLTQKNAPRADWPRQTATEFAGLAALAIERDADRRRMLAAEEAARRSEAGMRRMALAIEGSATGIWDRNIATGEIDYSSGWKALLGYTDAEISDRIEDSYARVHPDDLAFVQETIKAHWEGKTENYAVEHRVRCKDSSYKWISSRGKVVSRAADGKPLRMIGTTTDISAMRALSERLQQSVDLVTCLTNEVPGLAYQYRRLPDGDESFTYVSEGVRDIYELTPAQIGAGVAPLHSLIHPDDFAAYRVALAASGAGLQRLHLEFRVNLPRQGVRWRQIDARPRRLPDGGTLWHGFVTDVTERKRLELELQAQAAIDFLTQIPNRRCFMARMEEELARIRRAIGKPSAVLMCDLDNFKAINDSYGHATGDLVLKHFAGILQAALRKNDSAGRIGGEEFAVVLPGADLAEAHVFAQRVQQQLVATPLRAGRQTIAVTVSIGIAMMTDADADADAALSRSDTALYCAKENGRNRISIAVECAAEFTGQKLQAG